MKQSDNASSTTLNVRRFRDRQRALGLVKKDVWIRPEHASRLSEVERNLRHVDGSVLEADVPGWTIEQIEGLLRNTPQSRSGVMVVGRIDGSEPVLHLAIHGMTPDPIDILLTIGGDQIMVESFLWPVSRVRDVSTFNECILRTHRCLPLSNFSLSDVAEVPTYSLFGTMDTRSGLSSLLFELQALSENVMSVYDLYEDFLLPVSGEQS